MLKINHEDKQQKRDELIKEKEKILKEIEEEFGKELEKAKEFMPQNELDKLELPPGEFEEVRNRAKEIQDMISKGKAGITEDILRRNKKKKTEEFNERLEEMIMYTTYKKRVKKIEFVLMCKTVLLFYNFLNELNNESSKKPKTIPEMNEEIKKGFSELYKKYNADDTDQEDFGSKKEINEELNNNNKTAKKEKTIQEINQETKEGISKLHEKYFQNLKYLKNEKEINQELKENFLKLYKKYNEDDCLKNKKKQDK